MSSNNEKTVDNEIIVNEATKLIKEKFTLDEKIGTETTQILLEGDIIVPDVKPDMAVILQTDSNVVIDKKDATKDKITFGGRLDTQILYMGKGSDKPVYSIDVSSEINDYINMDQVSNDMRISITGEIYNMDYKMINDRKISYKAIVNILADVENCNTYDVVTNIDNIPQNQLLKSKLDLNRVVGSKEDRFIVKEHIPVPSNKANVRELLQVVPTIGSKEIKVSTGKANITGNVNLASLYKGDTEENFLEFMENEIPFEAEIEIDEAREDMFAEMDLKIQDQYVQVRQDEDGEDRVLEVEISIAASVKISCEEPIEVLADAFCINKSIETDKKSVNYQNVICRNKNQSHVKEILQIDTNSPDIMQIFRIKGAPHLDDVNVIDDKVIVEGVIDTDVLYVAENDDTPLYCYHTVIPYRQVIETKGSTDDMDAIIDVSLENVGFNLLSDREFEVKFVLSFNTKVIEDKTVEIVEDVTFSDLSQEYIDNLSSMTIYVVQPGDTLWKISREYNVLVDDIVSVNNIEDPNKIYPGQKLLILKKVDVA